MGVVPDGVVISVTVNVAHCRVALMASGPVFLSQQRGSVWPPSSFFHSTCLLPPAARSTGVKTPAFQPVPCGGVEASWHSIGLSLSWLQMYLASTLIR